MSENIPHSLGGFRGAFESEHGRKPTEQEIWNAAIRSWRDITRQKSDSARELEEVIADLLMYAGDNGYSHIDYADTMRHAAALLSAPALPVPSDSDDLIKALADVRDLFQIPERGSKLEHAWMEAVAFPESVPAYVRACIAPAALPVGELPEPFHPRASHISPDYRDGWNAALAAALTAGRQALEAT